MGDLCRSLGASPVPHGVLVSFVGKTHSGNKGLGRNRDRASWYVYGCVRNRDRASGYTLTANNVYSDGPKLEVEGGGQGIR